MPRAACYLLLIPLLLMAGCSTAPIQQGDTIEDAFYTPEQILGGGVTDYHDKGVYDPWEGLNRTIYRFNYHFDHYVFLPAVIAYSKVTPDIAQQGIHNFFTNIEDIATLFNSILQLSPEKTLNTTTRLLINSTIGLLGFIDVANDVPRSIEDFGQTLAYWGVGPGPYLVLPVMGPSTVRDGIGESVDWYVGYDLPRRWLTNTDSWQPEVVAVGTLRAIDTRKHVRFLYYETNSTFEYELVRLLWTAKRKLDTKR